MMIIMIIMKKIITLIILHFTILIYAQPGSVDNTFNPNDSGLSKGDGPNGTVRSTLLQLDGKIIIGGDFTNLTNGA